MNALSVLLFLLLNFFEAWSHAVVYASNQLTISPVDLRLLTILLLQHLKGFDY